MIRPEPAAAPVSAIAAEPAPDPLAGIEPSLVPEAYAAVRPNRPAIVARRRSLRLRRRMIVTGLAVLVAAAFVVVAAQAMGGTPPRRDVTVSVDGQASTIVTRAGTVGSLLAAQGVVVREGDRVTPSLSTPLEQGMPVHIIRAFGIRVDVDGTVSRHRTTRHRLGAIRRELGLPAGLVRVGEAAPIRRGDVVVLRTPHDVTLTVDGTSTPISAATALTVGELLAAQNISVAPTDEVAPALDAGLTTGMSVQVIRVTPDQVVEDKTIPFETEYRDDANLAAGHTRTIREGHNGRSRVVSDVVRKDGEITEWNVASSVVVEAPVTRIVARGTKKSGSQAPPPAPATGGGRSIGGGYATWYASHAGSGACAHLTLPFGTIVKLVASNGRTAQCRVGDRGPQAWTGNSIDLNPDVFQQLAPLGTGRIYVTMSIVG